MNTIVLKRFASGLFDVLGVCILLSCWIAGSSILFCKVSSFGLVPSMIGEVLH